MNTTPQAAQTFTVCVQNTGFKVSLDLHKIYPVLLDEDASRHGLVRVVDESGEDYLYPEALFVPIEPSEQLKRALLHAT